MEMGAEMAMSPETVKDHTERIAAHHEVHAGRELRKHRLLQGWLAHFTDNQVPPNRG